MTEKDIDRRLCRRFLQSCQAGDLDGARAALLEAQGHQPPAGKQSDWTVYRHEASGDTALHVAAREGRVVLVKYLCENWPAGLDYGPADVANLDMKRPLHEAAQFARYDVLHYLVQRGAEIDALKRGDWTPLMLACTKPGTDAQLCVKKLLEAGASATLRNKDGWTAFLLACRTGDPVTIDQLLRRMPRCVDDRSNNGRTPLHIAALHGRRDALRILLAAKPELLESRDSSGSRPLHESVKSLDFPVTDYLLEQGAYLGALDNVGQSVLHVAASVGNVAAIRYILADCGRAEIVGIDARTRYGVTPLQAAERCKQEEAARILRTRLAEGL